MGWQSIFMAVEYHQRLGNYAVRRVLALALTVLQASPTLPGIEHDSNRLYASILSIGPSVRLLMVLYSHLR